MLTYTDWLTLFRRHTGTGDSEARGVGTLNMNQGRKKVLKALESYITEDTYIATSEAGTPDYILPIHADKIDVITYTDGAIKYTPTKITSPEVWAQITMVNSPTSNVPTFVYIDKFRLSFFPLPATSTATIKALLTQTEPDLNQDDYKVGTISVTNGSAQVTGVSTNFTSNFVGRSILLPDGFWYEIVAVDSPTILHLVKRYEGSTASGAAVRIGQVSLIPDEGQELPVYFAAWQFWLPTDTKRALMFQQMFFGTPIRKNNGIHYYDGLNGLIATYRSRTESRLTPGSSIMAEVPNKNWYPESMGM